MDSQPNKHYFNLTLGTEVPKQVKDEKLVYYTYFSSCRHAFKQSKSEEYVRGDTIFGMHKFEIVSRRQIRPTRDELDLSFGD